MVPFLFRFLSISSGERIGDTSFETHMRVNHGRVKNILEHVTLIPFQTYDETLHDRNALRAHEGLWIKRFDLLHNGLNRRAESGHCKCMDFELESEKSKQKTKTESYRNKLRQP